MSNSNQVDNSKAIQDLQAEKREFELLFSLPAWKKFIEAKRSVLLGLADNWEQRFKTNDDLQFARGYITALKTEVMAMEQVVDANFSQRIEELQTGEISKAPEDLDDEQD